MLMNRIALDRHPKTVEALLNSTPELTEFTRKYYLRLGIPNKLSFGQLEHYIRQGTHHSILYGFIAEFGITPRENENLARAGVSFVLDQGEKFNAFHWAALSDTIAEGKVSRLEGHAKGIYHTKVVIDVDRVYKECGTSPLRRKREFWLLQTGPHQHGDHVDDRVDPAEPQFRRGERVLIMAGRNPLRLRNLVGRKLASETLHLLAENYGTPRQLLSVASKGQPGVLEIYSAYKVVRNNLVNKGGGYRVKSPTDVMDRKFFADRQDAIFAAQRTECRARVALVEES